MPLIKRYPNRKLYDTGASKYITLEEIADLIRQGSDVQVIDNTNGEDLTAVTLTQVIFEQEKKRSSLLPQPMLAGLFRTSSDHLSAIQRNLASSMGFLRQVDDEIRRRVETLVNHGDLSDDQGKVLLDKLLSSAELIQEEESPGLELMVRRFLADHNLPTRSDLERLAQELDTLNEKLDLLSQSNR